jgi:hypothetical protein
MEQIKKIKYLINIFLMIQLKSSINLSKIKLFIILEISSYEFLSNNNKKNHLKIEKWICGHLARLLGMKNPLKSKQQSNSQLVPKKLIKNNSCIDIGETSSKSLLANVLDINDDYFSRNSFRFGHKPAHYSSQSSEYFDESDPNPLKRNLNQILKELRILTQKIKDDEDDEEKELNWKFAAMVMDRLCMLFFASCTFFFTIIILLSSKNFFKFV